MATTLETFATNNHPFNILDTDLHDPKKVRELNWTGLNPDKAIPELKAVQRTLRIAPQPGHAQALLDKGFDSAHRVTSISKRQFIDQMAPALGPDGRKQAAAIYEAAEQATNQAMKVWGLVSHLSSPHFEALAANPVGSEVRAYFKGMPGYQDFFGSLDYCDCEECKSIFGPAAYFVDLLRIIDKKVTQQNPETIPAQMHLDERRPDLKLIPLSCENTNNVVPYINIVNQRLENALKPLGAGNDLYQKLAQLYFPFNLPFHLPLVRIRASLAQFNISLADVLRLLGADATHVAAELIDASPEEWALLTTSNTTDAALQASYGVDDLAKLNTLDCFCKQTGLQIPLVLNLFNENLSADELSVPPLSLGFFINQGQTAAPSISADKIANLNSAVLDRIHRFIRLANMLGWSFADLNWAIQAVRKGPGDIDPATLTALAGIRELAQQYKLTVPDVLVYLYDLKTIGRGKNPSASEAPFDIVFNGAGQSPRHPTYAGNRLYTDPVDVWDSAKADATNQKLSTWMAAGLGVREGDLNLLAGAFFNGKVDVTVENLSTLYRHARLARQLQFRIKDYLLFLKCFDLKKPAYSVEDLRKLFQAFKILQRSRLNVYQLNYIVDASAPASPYVPLPYQPDQLGHWFETLAKLIKKRDTKEVKARKLLTQLANLMHADERIISAILAVLGLDPADMAVGTPDQVTPQIKNLSRWLLIVVRLKLTVEDLKSIKASPNVYFNAPPWPSAGEVLELFLFKEAQGNLDDASEDLLEYMKAGNDAAAQAHVLAGFLPLEEDQITTLLTGMSGDTRVAALRKVMQISDYYRSTGAGVPLLTNLKDLAGKGASTDWPTYTTAAENLLAIFRARTTAEAWTALYTQIDGEVQAKLRTALVPTALIQFASKSETAWIKTDRNLYEYLLIDVGMSGCAQISYIKEGLNALQLYLHRCRERLEPGVEVLDIPTEWWEWIANYRIWEANRKIFLYPENYLDPSIRQSKTTLFKKLESSLNQGNLDPETVETAFRAYLDELTGLAKLVYVDAYYLNATGATAAGCSSFTAGSTTSIFFFARTQDEPYKYYYIVWQPGDIWSEWQEVNIPIPARHITPVFAFDRMFLFWVEQRTQKDVDAQNQKISVVKATIKYSFYNFGGNWVQPQTLLGETALSLSGAQQPSSFNGLFTPEFFRADRLVWNKVYCLSIAPGQYDSLLGGANKAEKLIVFFGPMLNTGDFASWQGPGAPPTSANPYVKELEGRLYNTALSFQKIKDLGLQGNLPAFSPIIRESDLQPNSLLSPNEIIFLRKDDTTVINFFRESIDRASGRLTLLASDQIINDNYDQERALAPAPADAKTPWVSAAMRNTHNALFAIANHPAAFVFQGDQESFLLQDPGKKTPSVSQMLFNAGTLFNANSLISNAGGIAAAGSAALYQALVDAGFLQSNGTLTPETDLRELAAQLHTQLSDPTKEGVAIDILADTPVFKASSFVVAGINSSGSEAIYKLLVSQGYLDAAGRLTADTDFYDLTNDLMKQLSDDSQVRAVVAILFQGPWPSLLGLIQSVPGPELKTYKFTATRLTTAAVHRLSSALFVGGIDRLLALPTQQIPVEPKLPYARLGFNTLNVTGPDAPDGAQVDFDGAYGLYYWELFFHAPHLIFSKLNGDQSFDKAEKWMKYIFDPTAPQVKIDKQSFATSTIGTAASEGIWKVLQDQKLVGSDGKVADSVNRNTDLTHYFKRLGLTPNQIISVLNILLNHQVGTSVARYWQFQKFRIQPLQSVSWMKDQLTDTNAINAYHCHPFDPHAIARLRIGAYEKAAVMQFIDNLLDWGDMEFRRYTWESITTATMYYVYAWNLLGPRPQSVGDCTFVPPKSYAEISTAYKAEIPEFLIQLETVVPQHPIALPKIPYNELDTYFCVPENSNFVAYWDRVEDRLFKIRHCLNIDGLKVPLALFEPPIDPMALARAAAAGADVLALFGGGSPIDNYYRFSVLLDRARAFTDTVTQFGATLLDVLEKNDAAALDRLRSTQEKAILNLTTVNLEHRLEEQKSLIEAAKRAKEIAGGRQHRYQKLIDGGWNDGEKADVALLSASVPFVMISALCIQIAGPLKLLPNIFGLADGGDDVWGPVEASATALEQDGKVLETLAEISAKAAEYQRREEEWEFERNEAREEAARIEIEIEAAETRLQILERELAIHEKTIAQAEEYETFLKAKFTNQDLYRWMSSRVSTVYSQAYHLALDQAVKAQAAYQFELSSADTFIDFESWDSIHKGLLAGEGLTLALNQMEAAYLQNNIPRMQLEKEISLLHLDPLKFMEFKTGINGATKGTLSFSLKEALFDGDFPGHYDRKIKAVSLTFLGAGLKGGAINGTLVQTAYTVVLSADPKAVGFVIKKDPSQPPDGTVRTNWLPNQSVALSRKQNDAGLFVLDFRYPDDQFYPFEGTGAVSEWTLTVPPQSNRIDFNAISDIVVKLWYTSRDGGASFASDVMGKYTDPKEPYPLPLARIIDVKAELGPENWQKFVSTATNNKYSFDMPLADGLFITNVADVALLSAELVVSATTSVSDEGSKHFVKLTVGDLVQDVPIAKNFGTVQLTAANLTADKIALVIDEQNLPAALKKDDKFNPAALQNLFIAIRFNSTAI